MLKSLLLYLVLPAFVIQACSVVAEEPISSSGTEAPEQPKRGRYTDEEVESLMRQYPHLSIGGYGTPTPEDTLEQLGIDTSALPLVDQWIGDCYDGSMYDLSPSYLLLVDRNACFGLKVWIERKDASG